MADINFFGRIGNLWKGFLSLWVADLEKERPEIAYEQAINAMVGKYTKLKEATAAVIRRRDEIDERAAKAQASLERLTRELDTALATDQDDLALLLLEKKTATEGDLASLTREAEQARSDAEDAKNSLLEVKGEIAKLKEERDRMLARMHSARARVQIQSQLEGLSVEAEVQALERVREHINNTVAQADLGKELRNSDLDVRLAKLRQQSGTATARAQLDELKRQRAQAAQATNKQM